MTWTLGIDPAHGGRESGVIKRLDGITFTEKGIVLAVAQQMRRQFVQNEALYFTREMDTYVSLEDRAKVLNEREVDFWVSLSIGSSSKRTMHGCAVYVNGEQRDVATMFAHHLGKLWGQLGLEGEVDVRTGEWALLERVRAPGIVIQLGYLTNRDESALLITEPF
ncbi:MAG: N-acetylmuramoyl-L-alanine amidase family protein, partial [Bacilli bacterium]